MSISLEERLLIDRYLDGTLSGLELQNFMERLDSDEDFRGRVSMQNLLVEGIIISADKELQARLLESLAYKKSRIPFGLKLIMTFLVLTVAGISLWNYIGSDRPVDKKDFLSFSWLSNSSIEENTSSVDEQSQDEKKSLQKTSMSESNLKNNKNGGEGVVNEHVEEFNSIDSLEVNEQNSEVVVKKDQMLISQRLIIHEDSSDQDDKRQTKGAKSSAQTKNVAKKLNPMAGLEMPEDEEKTHTHINVEFWVSPINYKGYKFFRNKIILFGIEEPESVVLYRRKDNIYMRYLNNYYLLEPTEEFASYQSVEEKEFSSAQRR